MGESSIKRFKAQKKPGVHCSVRVSSFQRLGFYGAALWEASPCFGTLLLVLGVLHELHGYRCLSHVQSRAVQLPCCYRWPCAGGEQYLVTEMLSAKFQPWPSHHGGSVPAAGAGLLSPRVACLGGVRRSGLEGAGSHSFARTHLVVFSSQSKIIWLSFLSLIPSVLHSSLASKIIMRLETQYNIPEKRQRGLQDFFRCCFISQCPANTIAKLCCFIYLPCCHNCFNIN